MFSVQGLGFRVCKERHKAKKLPPAAQERFGGGAEAAPSFVPAATQIQRCGISFYVPIFGNLPKR